MPILLVIVESRIQINFFLFPEWGGERGRGNTVATVKIPGVEMLTIFASFASNTFWLIINNLQMLKPILCQDNVNKSIIKLLHFNVQSLFSSQ